MDAIYEDVREYVYQLEYWMFNISTALGMVIGALMYVSHKRLLFVLFLIAMLISWYLFAKFYNVKQAYNKSEAITSRVKHFINSFHVVLFCRFDNAHCTSTDLRLHPFLSNYDIWIYYVEKGGEDIHIFSKIDRILGRFGLTPW